MECPAWNARYGVLRIEEQAIGHHLGFFKHQEHSVELYINGRWDLYLVTQISIALYLISKKFQPLMDNPKSKNLAKD
ncbi:hypothetical protein WJR50_06870 [Catalinimonas sp. 4WD22]|uniref:hypothetical protein n=1 Tax=Catalinimonas locisalis TaxID=3133978 RepID=UPI003100E761